MRTVPFAACIVAALVACGGIELHESEDAATERAEASHPVDGSNAAPEAGVSDASADASIAPSGGPDCPAVPPGNGDSCMPMDWQCEYGDAPNPWCDRLEKCYGNLGGWSYQALPVELCGVGTCPPSYADVVQGAVCPVQNLGCTYPEGQCDCGKTSDAGPPVWSCFSPTGCPEPRPRLGSGCAQDGEYCDYGACAGGAAEQCVLPYGWMQVLPMSCTYY